MWIGASLAVAAVHGVRAGVTLAVTAVHKVRAGVSLAVAAVHGVRAGVTLAVTAVHGVRAGVTLAVPPKSTRTRSAKPVPTSRTRSPPLDGPAAGCTELRIGTATRRQSPRGPHPGDAPFHVRAFHVRALEASASEASASQRICASRSAGSPHWPIDASAAAAT
jgi:hypothetical protein